MKLRSPIGKLKKYLKKFIFLFKIDWINSIRINMRLPIKQAIKLPILLFNSRVKIGRAEIVLEREADNCWFGMIKIGVRHSENILDKVGIQFTLLSGKLIFKGAGVIGNGSSLEIDGGNVCFGRNFGITGNFHLASKSGVTIGNNFSCSWNVSVYDTDFHDCINPMTGELLCSSVPITIGDNVWICQNSIILKRTVLPDWAVVGANSLCNKSYINIHKYSVIAGVPAKELNTFLQRSDIKIIDSHNNWEITRGLSVFQPLPDEP